VRFIGILDRELRIIHLPDKIIKKTPHRLDAYFEDETKYEVWSKISFIYTYFGTLRNLHKYYRLFDNLKDAKKMYDELIDVDIYRINSSRRQPSKKINCTESLTKMKFIKGDV
jgi:hypothetical protein